MASRGRRALRVDSESDDEDVRMLNGDASAASRSQHILLSDDEDNSFEPSVPLPPQGMPGVWQSVVDILHGRGVKPRTEWLLSCLNQLSASLPGFAQMTIARKAELCFEQFLVADFNVAGAALLPPLIHTLHATELPGPFVLQVDEIIDISNPLKDRYHDKAAGPGRTLKLSMTDGAQRVFGMEYRPIRSLQVLSPAGFKISVKDVCIRRGLLMLVPEIFEILGGVVDHLEAARLRAVEFINKPPRGRRVSQGAWDLPLIQRATLAAWRNDPSQQSVVPPPGGGHSTGMPTPGTTASVRAEGLQQRGQRQPVWEEQVADMRRRPARVAPTVHPAESLEVERSAAQRPSLQPAQRAQPSRESVPVSTTYQSRRTDIVQQHQHQPLQRSCDLEASRQSGMASSTPQTAKVEAECEEHHQHVPQGVAAGSSRQPDTGFVTHQALRVETVQPLHQDYDAESSRTSIHMDSGHLQYAQPTNQSHVLQHLPVSEPMRFPVSHIVELSTPPIIPSQSPGAPVLSPTFGKLSLRSRRSTQANVSFQTNIHSNQQSDLPLESTGAELERPVEILESQESEPGTPVGRSTISDVENTPFTYLATLDDRRKSLIGQHVQARGRVKCVIAGVGKFQYKGCDEFQLLVHIEDGTLITECFVAHQVVQDLVGHAPMEVSSKLANPDTHQEMLEKMIQFQKFLERFEGYMDLEFRDSSTVPIIVNIVEGVKPVDAKSLLGRLQRSAADQVSAGSKETIDLLTP